MRPDLTRVLYGAAATLATVGLALRIVPLRVRLPDAPRVALPPPAEPVNGAVQAQALLAYEDIARADPFVPQRVGRRPARRAPERASAAGSKWAVRLYGIATSPAGAVALIDADAAIPGAEVYHVGVCRDCQSLYR